MDFNEQKLSEDAIASQPRACALTERWKARGVCLLLATITWVVFGQTWSHEFINYDDQLYIYENPIVQRGLTWEGFRWALTYGEIGHWHPLTWLSHMLDCQFYDLQAGGHHLVNVMFHAAAAVLLFLVLRQMTGFLWRSAVVAAVFAIHPLRAESVAWVAERKDVMAAFFFMLTIGAYVRYVRHPGSKIRYGSLILLFALGLLSKNMLVTLPFVLLLLDYWPLNRTARFTPQVGIQLVVEKIPLFLLSALSCAATFLAPEKVPAVYRLPLAIRLENAAVSYVTYLGQMFFPAKLASLYPNPTDSLPLWQVSGALVLLLGVSGAVWARRGTRPYLAVGWLWYLGMTIPVIGIVQISYYAHADRYTYLPQIGLYIALTWVIAECSAGWSRRRWILTGVALMALIGLSLCAYRQTAYWKNSQTLWAHTLAVTKNNPVACANFAAVLLKDGRLDEALVYRQKVLEITPDNPDAHSDLGAVFLRQGQWDKSIACFQQALKIKPDCAIAHSNIGLVHLQKGELDEAIACFERALAIKPNYAEMHNFAEVHNDLGVALFQKGQVEEAIVHYQKALAIDPGSADAYNNLGRAFGRSGRREEEIFNYRKSLEINPGNARVHANLGTALFQEGAVDQAILHYQRALALEPDQAGIHQYLGFVYFQKGQVDEAIAHYQKALAIGPDDDASLHNNLGFALGLKGRTDEAIRHYEKALVLRPDYADPHFNLGDVFSQGGDGDKAVAHYQHALELRPDYIQAQNNLAFVLATWPRASLRDGSRAVELAHRANQLTGGENPIILGTLAAACAEAGQFGEALANAKKAADLARDAGQSGLARHLDIQIKLYETGHPFHEEEK